MYHKIIDFLGSLGTFIISLLLITILIALLPALTLWAINTISEQSGFKFYIPHNLYTYVSVIVLWLIITPVKYKK